MDIFIEQLCEYRRAKTIIKQTLNQYFRPIFTKVKQKNNAFKLRKQLVCINMYAIIILNNVLKMLIQY